MLVGAKDAYPNGEYALADYDDWFGESIAPADARRDAHPDEECALERADLGSCSRAHFAV